ncbi:hypothetical protein ANCDUO_24978 [Ancylostoma duodenale]|uniref:Uncharacterized protein n=1 Tax=Ancylostoma duodenale TaxID=51022 RepID=A0A0C2C5M3_9BILA|nr:hypothetical protein ANCDUO_24978 [Ancylostoma duodenale]
MPEVIDHAVQARSVALERKCEPNEIATIDELAVHPQQSTAPKPPQQPATPQLPRQPASEFENRT